MRSVRINTMVCAAMVGTLPQLLAAQATPPAQTNLSGDQSYEACQAIEDRRTRYECYDRVEASTPETESENGADTSQSERVDAPTSSQNEMDRFGVEPPARSRLEKLNDGNRELISTITALQERVPGRWLITLENGQVWYQTNSKRLRLEQDMEIRIYPSPMGGSFRLSASERNGFIQVDRVR